MHRHRAHATTTEEQGSSSTIVDCDSCQHSRGGATVVLLCRATKANEHERNERPIDERQARTLTVVPAGKSAQQIVHRSLSCFRLTSSAVSRQLARMCALLYKARRSCSLRNTSIARSQSETTQQNEGKEHLHAQQNPQILMYGIRKGLHISLDCHLMLLLDRCIQQGWS